MTSVPEDITKYIRIIRLMNSSYLVGKPLEVFLCFREIEFSFWNNLSAVFRARREVDKISPTIAADVHA